MSCRLNSFCSSSIELITYFRGIGRPPFSSSVMSRGQLKSKIRHFLIILINYDKIYQHRLCLGHICLELCISHC